MLKVEIISFGKVKYNEVEFLIDYYTKLCSKYYQVESKHIKDPGERKIRLKDIPQLDGYKVFLSEHGKQLDSRRFAEKIRDLKLNYSKITFVVGNAYGFESDALDMADLLFSLSEMTMPHDIAKLVLFEQLFRAGTILSGSSYHK